MDPKQQSVGLNFTPPSTLIDAMSEIQQYYLVEKSGQPLQSEFFTPTHVMGFANVGIKTALRDSIIWIITYVFLGAIIFYIQENYLQERATQVLFWQFEGSPLYWFAKLASFGGLIFSTVLCCMMSRFYTGTVPKKAVNTLFVTRAVFLLSFALVAFLILGLLYKYLMNDDVIRKIYEHLYKINQAVAVKTYYFLYSYFRRALFESGIIALIASFISIVVPFISITIFRVLKRRKKDLGLNTR